MDHSLFDKRKYPVVDVCEGYSEWVRTYEQTVHDEMDVRLLDRLRTIDWSSINSVLDLACGTGRIGAWLRARTSVRVAIDGIDLTPEMLEAARGRGIYRNLRVGNVTATELPAEAYDLCTQSLADEHLPELAPLYTEVARLTKPGGIFVIVGFHPQFLMAGVPTHFDRSPGESVTIRSYVHLFSDHAKAALASGWSLAEFDEGIVDDAWLAKKPKWQHYRGQPISFALVWRRTPLSL